MTATPNAVPDDEIVSGQPMTDTAMLLPCPFCGSDAAIVTHHLEATYGVECLRCDSKMLYSGFTEAEAAAAWNRRTPSPVTDDLRERVARAIAMADYNARDSGTPPKWSNWLNEADAALAVIPVADTRPTPTTDALRAERYKAALERIANGDSPLGRNGVPSSAEIARRALSGEGQ